MEIRDIDHTKHGAKNPNMKLMIDEELKEQFEGDNDLNNLLNSSNVLLKKIDEKLNDIEQDKISLLRLKQKVMKKIHDSIRSNVDDVLDRAVLYSIVTSDLNLDVASLSEQFDIREKEIAHRLISLKKRLNLPFD
jgi:predicted transcriptional regulator